MAPPAPICSCVRKWRVQVVNVFAFNSMRMPAEGAAPPTSVLCLADVHGAAARIWPRAALRHSRPSAEAACWARVHNISLLLLLLLEVVVVLGLLGIAGLLRLLFALLLRATCSTLRSRATCGLGRLAGLLHRWHVQERELDWGFSRTDLDLRTWICGRSNLPRKSRTDRVRAAGSVICG